MATSSTANTAAPGAAELQHILLEHEHYVAGRGGMRASLKGLVLDGADFSGRRLDEIDFAGASLAGTNFSNTSLTRASLYCADLRNARLHNAKLLQADIRGASFRGADLSFAVLDQADLRGATMMLVGPSGVSMINHVKDWDAFGGVDFSNSSLRNTSFGKAKLDGAIFDGAILVDTNFRGAQITNASFTGAVLMGIRLSDLNLPHEMFADCVFDVTPEAAARAFELRQAVEGHHQWVCSNGVRGATTSLDGADLRPLADQFVLRNLVGLSARGAIGIGLDFSNCQLQGAKFDAADLRGANFSGADLSGASFHAARLAHARFDRAKLTNLRLRNGGILAPNFLGADADPEQFRNAVLEDSLATLGLAIGTPVEL